MSKCTCLVGTSAIKGGHADSCPCHYNNLNETFYDKMVRKYPIIMEIEGLKNDIERLEEEKAELNKKIERLKNTIENICNYNGEATQDNEINDLCEQALAAPPQKG